MISEGLGGIDKSGVAELTFKGRGSNHQPSSSEP